MYYQEMYKWLDHYYSARTVTLTNREPPFVTPLIKHLLRLMRKGRVEEDGAIANRIGKLVAKANNVLLKDLGTRSSTKDLWSMINETRKTTTAHVPPSGITAETLNNHYPAISNDPLLG